ncbi:hypothetical protein M5D96_004337 [Drosophila gunungcola]|uniref:Uncharacterized protein n=1 Tax=Drosophila gunungcola TaxID=103775 RepID=A0A9Q0BSJ2_9MUSC|nr:hypothetical protein M5D96_004337 [Drosophila gunungcola]
MASWLSIVDEVAPVLLELLVGVWPAPALCVLEARLCTDSRSLSDSCVEERLPCRWLCPCPL